MKQILLAHVRSVGMSAQVARNLAIQFSPENPRVGINPDLCIIAPRTPEGDDLESLLLWEAEHPAPLLSIEIVSSNNARKDYVVAPDRHAASGVEELWVFDARLVGPKAFIDGVKPALHRRREHRPGKRAFPRG